MTFLIWLYQFIGAMFLGSMIYTELAIPDRRAKPMEWLLIVGLAAVWPYAFWLIYRQEAKK
jgi:hypothetical protein